MAAHLTPDISPSAESQGPASIGRLARISSGRRSKAIVLVIGVAVAAVLLAIGGPVSSNNDPTAGMPADAQSTQVVREQQRLPQAQRLPAIVVYSREHGSLTGGDRQRIQADRDRLQTLAIDGEVGAAVYAPGGRAALLSVALRSVPAGADGAAADRLGRSVKEIRRIVGGDREGLVAQVTGPAGFQVDLADVFDGANGLLLGVTALVVALLLLITYRSPWLWLVPLIVIGVADRVVSALLALLSRHAGLTADGATTGIVSVLVFGAGTNYALLLIARYREELRRYDDRHQAMAAALTRAVPAILASSTTVALSLATLMLAALPFDRNLGAAGALGIVTAVAFVLGLLPPALLLFGRGLFWPLVPRYGDENPAERGVWSRLGNAVTARPGPVVAAATLALVVLAAGNLGANLGLSQSQQLRAQPDSVKGQETIARTFGPGAAQPATIITATGTEQKVMRVAASTPGVSRVSVATAGAGLTQLDAQLTASPGSTEAFAAIKTLRARLHVVPGNAKVGGQDASDLDDKTAAAADRRLIVPLVLVVVLLVLVWLLRAPLAAVLLTLTNVGSWAAALGASTWAFEYLFGFPGIDLPIPLLSFLFLVALGVDYNIFLITRTREELTARTTRESIVAALASTGGVITSAGILLAAVFTVLGVLPIITLTQLGIVVGFGILLDTLLVRTVLVPALVTAVGDHFWWPTRY